EPADVGTRVHLALVAELHDVEPARDLLPHRLPVVEMGAALVDVAKLHGFAQADPTGVGLLGARDHLEQCRLAGPVRPDHADDAPGRQLEGEIVDEQLFAECLADAFDLHHYAAQARPRWDLDLRLAGLLVPGLLGQLLVSLNARPGFGLPRLG